MNKTEEITVTNLKGQRVVVTGATGFIGTHLCHKLYDLGAVVTSTSRSSASVHNFETVRVDLLRKTDFQALLSSTKANIVFHLASPVDPTRDESLVSTMDLGVIQTTKNVVDACLSAGVRLVVTGTCEEYGSSEAPFAEESELNPVSPYSFAKAQMTQFVMDTCRATELRATVVRPFLTYGPGQRSARLIPSAIRAALDGKAFEMTRGLQTREFNYISDIGDGIIASANEAAVGQIINIGGGEELSVIDVVRRIYTLCGADLSLIRAGAIGERSGEVSRFYGTHSKARTLLGHSPKIDLDEGLRATIAWWREQ